MGGGEREGEGGEGGGQRVPSGVGGGRGAQGWGAVRLPGPGVDEGRVQEGLMGPEVMGAGVGRGGRWDAVEASRHPSSVSASVHSSAPNALPGEPTPDLRCACGGRTPAWPATRGEAESSLPPCAERRGLSGPTGHPRLCASLQHNNDMACHGAARPVPSPPLPLVSPGPPPPSTHCTVFVGALPGGVAARDRGEMRPAALGLLKLIPLGQLQAQVRRELGVGGWESGVPGCVAGAGLSGPGRAASSSSAAQV